MSYIRHCAIAAFAVCLGALAGQARSGVIISGTRVVYSSEEKEVTVKLTNKGERPVLVQAWLDSGDSSLSPEQAKVPFVLSPPVFRMEGGKGQAVRLVYTDEPLPKDKETLFWFNVLEIPPKAGKDATNALQFALRTRIKVFFRPEGLHGEVESAASQLTWKLARNDASSDVILEVVNPTPYHVSFSEVGLMAGDRSARSRNGGMVLPRGTTTFPLPDSSGMNLGEARAHFKVINDYGAVKSMDAPIGR
ncbi:chaperone protein EcpD [Luteibacter sp. Sphag1AF]|uniref:fimbrial biogenesis chaperone n=1 Tax=Luteibacter sp. Sphag1AF TaxID=2587031 RepID=UPI0016103DC3|nr:fimbria/pilus periplasmic chaperone [Luteibacter sp. Sphag1AF]MBB3226979.1 chaperone protein EcpD [Luteibacter sp. Sphag1AF]